MNKIYWTLFNLIKKIVRYYIPSLWKDFSGWVWFWRDYNHYAALNQSSFSLKVKNIFPQLHDKTATTQVDPTYFYQDTWAFGLIVKQNPDWHLDVGSEHMYVGLLSKVLPVTMVDIRPLPTSLDSLTFREGSILALPYEDNSVPSVSSMCVIEHIGLGRYGDPLDPHGTEKALTELKRVVALNGDLYLSVPIDDENRTYFNAHRAFTEPYLLNLFAPFEVIEKRYIYGYYFGEQLQKGFGTGCYHLRKKL